MGSAFGKWFVSLLIIQSILMADEWSGSLHAILHGKLVKKYFSAPPVVKEIPFGWFVELDKSSQKEIEELFANLSEDEKLIYGDMNLKNVRLIISSFALKEWAHDHCEDLVTVDGEIQEPDLFDSELKAFNFVPEVVSPEISEEEKALACQRLDKNSWKFNSFDWSEKDLSDESLVLPVNEPERLVTMMGKLHLQIENSDPDYGAIENGGHPLYCWLLKLDSKSFEKACKTPVRASFQTPATIRSFKNCDEMELTGNYDTKWLCSHVDQIVSVKGYLWHAHTGHHHTPMMIDTDPWVKESLNNN